MAKSRSVLGSLALASALFAAPASASDWYVDAVNGNNANSGTDPSAAWRTITWAVVHAPAAAGEVIHVAEGTYDVVHGETFPIVLRPGQKLLGAARDSVLVGPHPAQFSYFAVVHMQSSSSADVYDPGSGLESLTLRGAYAAVRIESLAGVMAPTLRDLALLDTDAGGMSMYSSSALRATPTLERVDVRDGWVGMGVSTYGPGDILLRARDCSFSDCSLAGVILNSALTAYFDRCRIDRNGAYGVLLLTPPAGQLQNSLFRDSTLNANEGDAIHFDDPSLAGDVDVTLERCTLAANVGAGVYVASNAAAVDVSILDSILDGTGGDVAVLPGAQILAVNSMIRDGFASGVNGCFSADPLFRAPSAGDFRLAFGSPCIDRGSTFVGVPTDVLGHSRVVDGDLDLSQLSDLGAFEMRLLDGPSTMTPGELLTLEVWGPAGATSRVNWSRQPLLNNPTQTPFGPSYLQQPLLFRLITTSGAVPTLVSRLVPPSPAYIGLSFSFQARTQSSAAPAGEAYTNPLSITIVP